MRARIRTRDELVRIFSLSADEFDAVSRHKGSLPVGITPYYASLMGLKDACEPLRRTHIMTGDEYLTTAGEDDDPLPKTTTWPRPGWSTAIPTASCS
ncbi:MAG: hypothetical protein WDM81_01720 [Rhizomicrobium sp.]